jgi:hypothetical protein
LRRVDPQLSKRVSRQRRRLFFLCSTRLGTYGFFGAGGGVTGSGRREIEGHTSDFVESLGIASRSTGVRIITRPNKPKQRSRDIGELPLSDAAKLFEDRERPDQWRVERLGDSGRSEMRKLNGPNALRRALRYAMQKYRRMVHGHP